MHDALGLKKRKVKIKRSNRSDTSFPRGKFKISTISSSVRYSRLFTFKRSSPLTDSHRDRGQLVHVFSTRNIPPSRKVQSVKCIKIIFSAVLNRGDPLVLRKCILCQTNPLQQSRSVVHVNPLLSLRNERAIVSNSILLCVSRVYARTIEGYRMYRARPVRRGKACRIFMTGALCACLR